MMNSETFNENLNIRIKTIAAQGTWSNGLLETRDPIIAEAVRTTKDDSNCSLDMALAWALSAKN